MKKGVLEISQNSQENSFRKIASPPASSSQQIPLGLGLGLR